MARLNGRELNKAAEALTPKVVVGTILSAPILSNIRTTGVGPFVLLFDLSNPSSIAFDMMDVYFKTDSGAFVSFDPSVSYATPYDSSNSGLTIVAGHTYSFYVVARYLDLVSSNSNIISITK